ncbi:hypothetical protein AK812_SmicGene17372 [Symbiodinium microadriaticum]|uniref:Uncharacterized protein n=1 Tax=Symbiodinium microadriaticum TaxID=2951 RepID=A0A1Q9DXZ2_SYMMI|nr:hypothetical protein AK812_SmicGene17372 [Symbiodinium microadriaticum]
MHRTLTAAAVFIAEIAAEVAYFCVQLSEGFREYVFNSSVVQDANIHDLTVTGKKAVLDILQGTAFDVFAFDIKFTSPSGAESYQDSIFPSAGPSKIRYISQRVLGFLGSVCDIDVGVLSDIDTVFSVILSSKAVVKNVRHEYDKAEPDDSTLQFPTLNFGIAGQALGEFSQACGVEEMLSSFCEGIHEYLHDFISMSPEQYVLAYNRSSFCEGIHEYLHDFISSNATGQKCSRHEYDKAEPDDSTFQFPTLNFGIAGQALGEFSQACGVEEMLSSFCEGIHEYLHDFISSQGVLASIVQFDVFAFAFDDISTSPSGALEHMVFQVCEVSLRVIVIRAFNGTPREYTNGGSRHLAQRVLHYEHVLSFLVGGVEEMLGLKIV